LCLNIVWLRQEKKDKRPFVDDGNIRYNKRINQAIRYIIEELKMTHCTEKEMDFSVFLIRKLAEKWRTSTPETYKILTDTKIMDDYILKCYDTLHTMGTEYLVEDVTEFVHEKGVVI
jgi:hypothetical protein